MVPHRKGLSVEDQRGSTGIHDRHLTIGILPDDTLLQIFKIYMLEGVHQVWFNLVHVCRRWRDLVFASPRHLNLQLFITNRKSVRKMLDIWPVLPIVIDGLWIQALPLHDTDDLIAALKYRDRICKITFSIFSNPLSERFTATVMEPFPELKYLALWSFDRVRSAPILPESVFGGSVPRLQALSFLHISTPFPTLQKLLLSANHLVDLGLRDIPPSGYISPQAMATCISVLTRLETLHLGFTSLPNLPDQTSRFLPPLTRAVLPALSLLDFTGTSEYLDVLTSQIDAPRLKRARSTFFSQPISDVSQLHQFISRIGTFKAPSLARVSFFEHSVEIAFYPHRESTIFERDIVFEFGLSCAVSHWQISSLALLCTSSMSLPSSVQRLDLTGKIHEDDGPETTQWREFLRLFTNVKDLYLSQDVACHVAYALGELVGRRAITVFPVLQNIFITKGEYWATIQEVITPFVSARKLSNLPITVKRWKSR
ncbi:hypothetical protein BC826DRAFT_1064926 [Russula brevipes]|nr:hypothetical protein BC826DRAFT_1064926 [Russula brevipes]